ncbi:MAG: pantetheine-phosphate adenylyltransferase [Acidimicrobiia bacterium]|nr:pantetheine-phosphate adenylyltransferase [Acidimicrobiia bacterium]
MTVAVVPGSFDPPTLGHVDVIARAAGVFERVVIAVVTNPSKSSLFTADERKAMLEDICAEWGNIEVDDFPGLLVDFVREKGAGVIVKGLRAVADFEYELQMAQMNHHLSGVQTVFMPTSPEHAYLSSSLVKEVGRFGASLEGLVSPVVAAALKERFE